MFISKRMRFYLSDLICISFLSFCFCVGSIATFVVDGLSVQSYLFLSLTCLFFIFNILYCVNYLYDCFIKKKGYDDKATIVKVYSRQYRSGTINYIKYGYINNKGRILYTRERVSKITHEFRKNEKIHVKSNGRKSLLNFEKYKWYSK